jgi:CO/xanthine dehydrogenase Mo-binding subunit
MTAVGSPEFVRPDGRQKVSGRAIYTADMQLTGMLYGRFLYAAHPRARIRSVDVAAARRLPGVHAVITQADMPPVRYGMFVKDRTLFADGMVRFEAEIVAAVAAQTPEIAEQACRAIAVDYEPLEPILDPERALGPDSPLVHERWEEYATRPGVDRDGNGCGHVTSLKGDPEREFAEAELVVRDRFTTDMSHAVPIEPHAVIAQWQGEKVTIWSTSQVPYPARSGTAEALQLPESHVRIVVPHLGGGFGGKCDVHFEPHVAALARAAGRPVKLVFSRREEFLATDKVRHAMNIELETAVGRDGVIKARRARIVLDGGAYVGDGLFASEIANMMVQGPYRIPHVFAETHTVYTNRTPAGSVRAPGGPQLCWAVEQHSDHIAAEVGIDPVEFRRRNLVADGDTGQTEQVLEAVSARECLDRALEISGWGKELQGNEALGVGCGWWFTLPAPSGAYLKLNADGSATIITGAQENGSGAVMALPLLAAQELGMRPDDFSLLYQDTDAGPWDLGSAGSQTTANNGRAVVASARVLKRKLLDLASTELEIDPEDLELVGGAVRVRGLPSRGLTIKELAVKAQGGELLLAEGSGMPPALPAHNLSGCAGRLDYAAFGAPSFFAVVAHVWVDRDTGVVRVREITAVHDVGRLLNRIGAEGQVEGGVVHAIGMALLEGAQYDGGHQRNPHMLDYKLQTTVDAPRINVEFVERPSTQGGGPGGLKAVGEPPVVAPAAAIANAVRAATGTAVPALPMTPARVWQALQAVEQAL